MDAATASSTEDPLVQPLCAIFRRFLKRQGLKFTPERAKVLDAVLARAGVFDPDQLLDAIPRDSKGKRLSKATIYRTLKHLVEAHIVSAVLLDANQAHYQLTFGREPKGYLVCVETHQVIEFDAPELTAIRQRICAEHQFQPLSHRFVIYGISPQGQAQAQNPGA
jgi:Fur family ferric uptake transcriptional regulator